MQNARVVPADDDDDDQATEMNNSFTGKGAAAEPKVSDPGFPGLHTCSVCFASSPLDVCLSVSEYSCMCPRLGTQKEGDNVCMFIIFSSAVQ